MVSSQIPSWAVIFALLCLVVSIMRSVEASKGQIGGIPAVAGRWDSTAKDKAA